MLNEATNQLMISTAEASQITGLSQRSIVRLCVAGKLPAVQLGRRWLINRKKFMDNLECHAEGGAPVEC